MAVDEPLLGEHEYRWVKLITENDLTDMTVTYTDGTTEVFQIIEKTTN